MFFYSSKRDLLCRDETGKFPDYPSDEEGGSAAVFHPELHADQEGSEAAKNSEEAPVRISSHFFSCRSEG